MAKKDEPEDEFVEIIDQGLTQTAPPSSVLTPEEPIRRIEPPAPREPEEKVVPAESKPTSKASAKVNLDDFEEFRTVKSGYDKKLAEAAKHTAALQAQLAAQQATQYAAYEQQLQQQMQSYNPDQQVEAAKQIGQIEAMRYAQSIKAWDAHMRNRILEEGLDPVDERFVKQYTPGEVGGWEFEADLRAAKVERLQGENKTLKTQVEGIGPTIEKLLAEKLRALGFDATDTGEGTMPSDAEGSFERDTRAFQNGQMSPAEYRKRHGGR